MLVRMLVTQVLLCTMRDANNLKHRIGLTRLSILAEHTYRSPCHLGYSVLIETQVLWALSVGGAFQ
jgi:hypothetical protein